MNVNLEELLGRIITIRNSDSSKVDTGFVYSSRGNYELIVPITEEVLQRRNIKAIYDDENPSKRVPCISFPFLPGDFMKIIIDEKTTLQMEGDEVIIINPYEDIWKAYFKEYANQEFQDIADFYQKLSQ